MKPIRPTKKQRQLLDFIERFIRENGYGPSYREIMRGCSYSSVSTVAVHVDNLIKRGHLKKRDNSARSLEVVTPTDVSDKTPIRVSEKEEKWLVDVVDQKFVEVHAKSRVEQKDLDQLYVLVGALTVLGFDGAAVAFKSKLKELDP